MLSQEKFFYTLNQSINSTTKKTLWGNYIREVTTRILSSVSEADHLLILGAGGCDDFDLAEIVKRVKKVTISDIDLGSMKQGLLKQGMKRDQVGLLQKDYTRLSEYEFFRKFDIMVKEGQSVKDICHYIKLIFQELQEKNLVEVNQVIVEADVVVVLPIYSQLVLPLYHVIMGQTASFYSENDLMAIQNTFLEYSINAIHVMNGYLWAYARKGTKILLFADILEYQEGNPVYNQLEALSKEEIRELEASYIEGFGYGYGHYGIEHLSGTVALKAVDYLIWPYSKNRKLIVKVLVN